jgi:broad specificity phosphatase PhoE
MFYKFDFCLYKYRIKLIVNMVLIYIIRHGETDMNIGNKVNDGNINTQINNTGKKQAKKTGEYLKKIRKLNSSNCIIYTSPSLRAVQTATIIKNIIDKKLTVKLDKRLFEMGKGVLSGLSKTDPLKKKYDNIINKAMKKGDTLYQRETIISVLNKIDPKFGVESTIQIKKRITDFFNQLPVNIKNIVIVTHAGIITSTLVNIMNIMQVVNGDVSKGKNCTITVIKKENIHKPVYTLLTFPNTEHL